MYKLLLTRYRSNGIIFVIMPEAPRVNNLLQRNIF